MKERHFDCYFLDSNDAFLPFYLYQKFIKICHGMQDFGGKSNTSTDCGFMAKNDGGP